MREAPPARATPPGAFLAVCVGGIVVLFALRMALAGTRVFDEDEFQHLHNAFCVWSGLVPYRDYFEHHTPWFWALLQVVFPFSGARPETLIVSRYLMLLVAAAVIGAASALGTLLEGRGVGVLTALLLSGMTTFVSSTLEIRPDGAAVAVLLGAFWAYEQARRSGRLRWHAVAGLAVGTAIMLTQKTLFVAGGLGAAVSGQALWSWRAGNRPVLRRVGVLAAAATIPGLVTWAWFAAHGAGRVFFRDNFLVNARWPYQGPVLPELTQIVLANGVVVAVGLVGLLLGWADVIRRRAGAAALVAPLAGLSAGLAGIFVIPVAYAQYYELFLPLFALFAARLVLRALTADGAARREAVRLLLIAVAMGLAIDWLTRESPGPRGLAVALVLFGAGLLVRRAWIPRRPALAVLAAVLVAAVIWIARPPDGPRWILAVSAIPFAAALRPAWYGTLVGLGLALAGPMRVLLADLGDTNAWQLYVVRYVDEHVSPTETVLGGWRGWGVFRPHAYFYWFLHEEIRAKLTPAEQGPDVLRALRERRPKLVTWDIQVRALAPEVQAYLREHYAPTGVGELYERIDGR